MFQAHRGLKGRMIPTREARFGIIRFLKCKSLRLADTRAAHFATKHNSKRRSNAKKVNRLPTIEGTMAHQSLREAYITS